MLITLDMLYENTSGLQQKVKSEQAMEETQMCGENEKKVHEENQITIIDTKNHTGERQTKVEMPKFRSKENEDQVSSLALVIWVICLILFITKIYIIHFVLK